jgi:GxxExxY protein
MTAVNHGATETQGTHHDVNEGAIVAGAGAMERVNGPRGASHAPIPESLNVLTGRIIGCAIDVHKALGPGLLESAYECAFCVELAHEGLHFQRQVGCPVIYRGRAVGEYRLDLLVENQIVVEVKAVERFAPVYIAQVLTYLRATERRLGLIINFNVPVLRDGVRRVAL